MTQQPPTQNYFVSNPQPQPTNVLGVVGFVLVMIGTIGFCFTPALGVGMIGTVLCAVGIAREPKGLAIAGLIIGIIEVVIGAIILLTVGAMCGACGIGLGAAGQAIETQTDGQAIRAELESYYLQNGEYPASLDALSLDADTLTDGWKNAFRYERTNGGFGLSSDGADGRAGTADDVDFSREAGPATSPATRPAGQ